MNKNEEYYFLKRQDGILVPEEHTDYAHHFIVFSHQTVTEMLGEIGVVVTGKIERPSEIDTSFLGGIKIRDQDIAAHNDITGALFDSAGVQLGTFWNTQTYETSPGFFLIISLVSTDFDVTSRDGNPLPNAVFVIPKGERAQIKLTEDPNMSPNDNPKPN